MCFTRFVKYCWFYELKSPHHAGLHVKASYCVSAVLSDLQIETFYISDKFKVYSIPLF